MSSLQIQVLDVTMDTDCCCHLAELYSGLPCSDLVGEGQVVGLEGAVSFW